MEAQSLSPRIYAVRKALPSDRLRFYVADGDDPTDVQYLTILFTLYDASTVGAGDMAHDDLVEQVDDHLHAVLGKSLPEDILEARLRSLEAWGNIEKFPETENAGLTLFRRSYTRYRITADGLFVMDNLTSAARRRERRVSNQDALNALTSIEASLDSITQALANVPREHKKRTEALSQAYITLYRIIRGDYENLNEYLRDLNRRILTFTNSRDLDYENLEFILQRLEAYMEGVYTKFRPKSRSILEKCHGLREGDSWGLLLDGYELAKAEDENNRLDHMEAKLPSPDDLIRRLTAFFDDTNRRGLIKEIRTIQGNTVRVIASIRDHWQRLMERSAYVQQLEKAWTTIENTPLEDEAAWQSILAWGGQLFDVQRVRTAPGLGSIDEAGKPPMPRRRYVRRSDTQRTVTLQQRKGTMEQVRRLEEELGVSLNEFVQKRILRGRDTALLSDFKLNDHEDFRRIVTLAKHSELVLNTAIAKSYFQFRVEYAEKDRVKWTRGDMSYDAPELRFTAAPNQDVPYA